MASRKAIAFSITAAGFTVLIKETNLILSYLPNEEVKYQSFESLAKDSNSAAQKQSARVHYKEMLT